MAGDSCSRWGLRGAGEEEHLSLALVCEVTYGDTQPQLSCVPQDGVCGMGRSSDKVPKDKLGQPGSILGAV